MVLNGKPEEFSIIHIKMNYFLRFEHQNSICLYDMIKQLKSSSRLSSIFHIGPGFTCKFKYDLKHCQERGNFVRTEETCFLI